MKNQETQKLSRGTVRLIQEAIAKAKEEGRPFQDRYVLCEVLCALVEEKYSGLTLDYQLKRMNLVTTKPVLEAIDLFFYKYPKFLSDTEPTTEEVK